VLRLHVPSELLERPPAARADPGGGAGAELVPLILEPCLGGALCLLGGVRLVELRLEVGRPVTLAFQLGLVRVAEDEAVAERAVDLLLGVVAGVAEQVRWDADRDTAPAGRDL
jgi:hypothetical protein